MNVGSNCSINGCVLAGSQSLAPLHASEADPDPPNRPLAGFAAGGLFLQCLPKPQPRPRPPRPRRWGERAMRQHRKTQRSAPPPVLRPRRIVDACLLTDRLIMLFLASWRAARRPRGSDGAGRWRPNSRAAATPYQHQAPAVSPPPRHPTHPLTHAARPPTLFLTAQAADRPQAGGPLWRGRGPRRHQRAAGRPPPAHAAGNHRVRARRRAGRAAAGGAAVPGGAHDERLPGGAALWGDV